MLAISPSSSALLATGSRGWLPAASRNAAIALSVLLLHVGFIYAMYSGLLIRAVELVVPVVVLSQFIEPPKPKEAPPPPPPPPPAQVKKATTQLTQAPVAAAPLPMAINDPTPAVNAPSGSTLPQPAPAPIAAPVAAVAAAPSAAPAVQLPSSDADYLQNPKPAYPAISRRMNEQGKTVVRILIGADGQPQKAEIGKSSGFSRLDDAAVATVMRWRFVPGKRGGVAEAMWFNVPINWVLE